MIPRFTIVHERTAAIVERFGKFNRILEPGWHLVMAFERVAKKMSLRVEEMTVQIETKTLDDVFVKMEVAVQYQVMPDRVADAFYQLAHPVRQIQSYVFDEVRAQVPKMKLDDVFQNKDDIANAVREGLEGTMNQFGFAILKSLVSDIDPAPNVKQAMNEINAAQRHRRAAEERGEAEKVLKVKEAEAEAEAMKLRGQGVADQRRAIMEGLQQSVQAFQEGVPGASADDVMRLLMMTQYFDTLKDLGAGGRTNTIMVPHSPTALTDLSEQIRQSVTVGEVVAGQARREAERADRPGGPDPSAPRRSPEPSAGDS
ncbi:MAG: SPFH domain-containing protein [Acidobacteriota bacterium]|jgi:regulator of protease activity HflC (stomatin/prohibitin superfamily)